MKRYKTRLLMAFTTLAVVLVVSAPALADDVEVECEADDGTCKGTLEWSSDQYEDVGSEFPEETVDPESVESEEDCFPFCGLEWWPW